MDREGNPISQTLENYTARIFQHEVDHLNGERFPDRLNDFSKLHKVKSEEREEYREKFETWPHTCSRDEWLSLIGD